MISFFNKRAYKRKRETAKRHILKYSIEYLLLVFVAYTYHGVYMFFASASEMLFWSAYMKFFVGVIALISVIFIVIQFRSNHDWNRRQLAMITLREIRKDLRSKAFVLQKSFKYIKRIEPISVEEIYNIIGEKNADGQLLKDDKGVFMLDDSEEKHEIKEAIFEVLGTYEHIAVGVYNKTLDEKIIKDLISGGIQKASKIFNPYIEYLNEIVFIDRDQKVWCELQRLAAKFKAEEDKDRKIDEEEKEKEATAELEKKEKLDESKSRNSVEDG